MKIQSFPKIFSIGTPYIKNIFDEKVYITEKVDGSQFAFGMIDGELLLRSKGAQIFPESPQKMFSNGVDYVMTLYDELQLHEGDIYYCEYLQKPKHNVISYERIPKNYLALFGVYSIHDNKWFSDVELDEEADRIGIDSVPLLFTGIINEKNILNTLNDLLNTESFLGHPYIEGFVVKRYVDYIVGGQVLPLMAGKYVSEKFKEVHRSEWKKENTGKGKWDLFKESYRTEARWEKAIQHLRDEDKLVNEPKDIGPLIKEIMRDITDEEKEIIKDKLWKEFGSDLLRKSVAGFPEWYKERLMKSSFE